MLNFGEEGSGKIRMLGCWMGWKEDVYERLKRAGKAWCTKGPRLAEIPEGAHF